MKKNTFFKLFIIFLIAVFFRVWFLDKPEGLYFDEYYTWMIAKTDNITEFIKMVMQNCHTPLYYFYLKLWMFLFNDTDISLRWSSVIPSLISIYIMYLSGKALKDDKCGYICALITALSSFCIYFSQDVRPYSLIFLISSLIYLFFIKTVKNPVNYNFVIFFILNAILCSLHTLGIIFSFFIIIALFSFLYNSNSDYNKKLFNIVLKLKYFAPFIIVLLFLLPILCNIMLSKNLSQFWSDFSFTKIFCTFTDYFSPLQTNIINTQATIMSYFFYKSKLNYIYIIFAIIPSIIAFCSLIKALMSGNKLLNYIFVSGILYYSVLVILAISGKIILVTKYSTEIYPILILTFVYGVLSFERKIVRTVFLTIFILLNVIYLYLSDDSAAKRTRPEGHRAAAELLKNSKLKSGDFVILTYYGKDKFERYLPSNINYNFYSIDKYNFNYTMFNNNDYNNVISKGKALYKENFRTNSNIYLEKQVRDNVLNKLSKGSRVGLIILNNVSFLDSGFIADAADDAERYDKIPFIFLVFSSLKNNMLNILKADLQLETIISAGDWTLYVYYKNN